MAADPRRRNILLQGDDAMEEDEEDVLLDQPIAIPDNLIGTNAVRNRELISTIIQPSPFPHHTTGPTSSRFRTSLQRIQSDPEADVEAWQALMTEVGYCYRQVLPKIHAVDAEIQLQLDWIESCYGALLQFFPYSAIHYAGVAEILLVQSARVGEEHGPLADYGLDHQRQMTCQAKLERIFELTLGIKMDGSPITIEEDKEDPVGGMCTFSTELWLLYVQTRSREAQRTNVSIFKEWTTKAYELALQHTGFGFQNHVVWKAYLNWAKGATIGDPQQMTTLRNIYQRLVCHPMTGLDQLWQEYEVFERQQSEALAAALISEFTPKYQHARTVYLERNRVFNAQDLQLGVKLATPPKEDEVAEEFDSLQLWKTRTAYERTNPERLAGADLTLRIRTAYKEMASVWTRHPDIWHMWSTWEEHFSGSGGIDRAIAVLEKGQGQIPDSTLLAHAQAQLTELHNKDDPTGCLDVMENFVSRAPNTLGFTLYQQMVRRYKGKDAARAVFAKARRVLRNDTNAFTKKSLKSDDAAATGTTEDSKEDTEKPGGHETQRWMVTNRLDPEIGKANGNSGAPPTQADAEDGKITPGPITWHLYAAHATIEHRLNKSPDVAARVYELGLRKHESFLTKPPYVLKYAQLLMELQDTVNLRALLTRSLAACIGKSMSVTALWDMAVEFESLVSIGDPTNLPSVVEMERKRRVALLGPEIEDVATGSRVGLADAPTIGAQKTTISEQLVRQDGYDLSSAVVNGLSRTVDVLDIMGVWSNDSSNTRFNLAKGEDEDDIPGGKSDRLYQQRLLFARLTAFGGQVDSGGDNGPRLASARERLQTGGASQNTAMTMAIKNSPDWLRELLLILPASRSRVAVLAPPPPHLTEMALAALKQNELPSERPQDDKKVSGGKRSLDGGDSSDEEGGSGRGGGYGTQFRLRQRARQLALNSNGAKSDN